MGNKIIDIKEVWVNGKYRDFFENGVKEVNKIYGEWGIPTERRYVTGSSAFFLQGYKIHIMGDEILAFSSQIGINTGGRPLIENMFIGMSTTNISTQLDILVSKDDLPFEIENFDIIYKRFLPAMKRDKLYIDGNRKLYKEFPVYVEPPKDSNEKLQLEKLRKDLDLIVNIYAIQNRLFPKGLECKLSDNGTIYLTSVDYMTQLLTELIRFRLNYSKKMLKELKEGLEKMKSIKEEEKKNDYASSELVPRADAGQEFERIAKGRLKVIEEIKKNAEIKGDNDITSICEKIINECSERVWGK